MKNDTLSKSAVLRLNPQDTTANSALNFKYLFKLFIRQQCKIKQENIHKYAKSDL